MNVAFSLLAVLLLIVVAWGGVTGFGLTLFFGVLVPCGAFLIFVGGFIYRVLKWGSAPVPFHIPTICGQQKSFAWIPSNPIDSPTTAKGVAARLGLEILFFRSLFWNERVEMKRAHQLLFKRNLYLWLGGLGFHWCLFVVLFRHLRFFFEPVPSPVLVAQFLDGILQNLFPSIYITDFFLFTGLLYLLIRRLRDPQLRYISLPSDYFPLFLILGVVLSGVLMLLVWNVDLVRVKGHMVRLMSFQPALQEGLGAIFYIHLCLVSVLIAYFPFSKLMHLAGVFLSPTRNLKNTSRKERHVNPWDYPVKVHTYKEYEEEFRDSMKQAGVPVEEEGAKG